MPARRVLIALLALVSASLALTSTMLLLKMPEKSQEDAALAKWEQDTGFLSNANLHVFPILPRSRAQDRTDLSIYPRLSNQVMRAGEWFNKGANGRRVIFSGVTEMPTRVLTPKPAVDAAIPGEKLDSRNWKHDCSDLVNLGASMGATLGEGKVAVLLVERTWKCPFVGLAGFRSNWVIITGWDADENKINYFTLIHELGHTLGLPHARKYRCTASAGIYEEPSTLAKCDIAEYGDTSDPMGSTIDQMYPGFNAFNRYLIGWNDAPEVLELPGRYDLIIPAASLGLTAYVEVPGGFIISYRAPTKEKNDIDNKLGFDSYLGDFTGVYLHRKASNTGDGSTYPVLLPFRKMQTAGKVGDHYVSEEANMAFIVTDIVKGKHAKVTVIIGTKSKPVKDTWGPVPVLITMQDFGGKYLQAQWDAFDPSGIQEAYVVVDGKRQEAPLSGAILLPYGDKPQDMYFVAIDNQGNRSESQVFVVPAMQ